MNNPQSLKIKLQLQLSGGTKTPPLVALLDTGSECSLISDRMCNLYNVPVEYVSKQLEVIGDTCAIEGRVKSCIFSIGDLNYEPVDCNIFSHTGVSDSIDLLLGVDFLAVNQLEVAVGEKLLIKRSPGGGRREQCFGHEGNLEQTLHCSVPCYAVKTVKLSPQTINAVEICHDLPCVDSTTNVRYYFEQDISNRRLTTNVAALNGITHAGQRFVLMTNHESESLVKQGERIGTMSTLVEFPNYFARDDVVDPPSSANGVGVGLAHLGDSEQKQFLEMLSRPEITSAFSKGGMDIGLANVTKHKIRVSDETPICAKLRSFPGPVSKEIEDQCRQLEEIGVIEPSNSSWSSPVVPVRKKDGSVRLCIDYRALNNVTISDKFPLPNLQDTIFGLRGARYFTKLDLVKAYYQIPVEEESKKYTAFASAKGLWQFARLPFGLKNAPSAFQREIAAVLGAVPSKNVLVYLDDILVINDTFNSHVKLVGEVLEALAGNGMRVNRDKCEWVRSEVEYLGHVVSEHGVRKTDAYVKQIAEYPRPTTVGEMRSFLGLVNFQRKFLPHASSLQKPLSACTSGRRSRRLTWTGEMQTAFETIKTEMQADMTLAYPDYSEDAPDLELWVDASAQGAGAYLAQVQGDCHRVLGFASTTFNAAELNYSTIEKELSALRWGIRTFRAFLYGVHFSLHTDHMPLVYLFSMKLICSRLARTIQELSEFTFTIKYVPGRLNNAADTLSRLSTPPVPLESLEDISLPEGCVLDGAPVPGGGDSLFESLLKCLTRKCITNVPSNPLELRQVLVDELLGHPERYNLKLDRNSRRGLRLMRLKMQLPSLEVLMAASKLFKINIYVYFWSEQPVVYQFDKFNVSIYLQAVSGGVHYNPLVCLREDPEPNAHVHTMFSSTLDSTSGPSNDTASPRCSDTEEAEDPPSSGEDGKVSNCVDVTRQESARCRHKPGTHPTITLDLGVFQSCALLDTGSEISLVTYEVVKRLMTIQGEQRIPQADNCCTLIGFTGQKVAVTQSITLSFKVGDKQITNFKFYVVKNNLFPKCFLLGLDFLSPFNVTINLVRQTCSIGTATVEIVRPDPAIYVGARPRELQTFAVHAAPLNGTRLSVSQDASDFRFELTDLNNSTIYNMSLCADDKTLIALQNSCSTLGLLKLKLKNCVPTARWPNKLRLYKKHAGSLKLINNVLVNGESSRPLMPFKTLCQCAVTLHREYAHVGRDKISHLIRSCLFHPSIFKVTNDVTRSCHQCQVTKISPLTIIPPTLKIHTAQPYELVAADLLALPATPSGHIACLVVVDHYTKWVSAAPLKDKRASTVVKALKNHVFPSLLALPQCMLTDNGREFSNDELSDLLGTLGIRHKLTTPYHPASNGAVERVNRTIQSLFRSVMDEGDHWDEHLSQVVRTYNATYHAEIQTSPAEFILTKAHEVNVLRGNQTLQKWQEGHGRFTPYSAGQKVLRQVQLKGYLTTNKFAHRYLGPVTISRVNANGVTYEVEDHRGALSPVHHTQLRPYITPPHYLQRYATTPGADTGQEEPGSDDQGPLVGSDTPYL